MAVVPLPVPSNAGGRQLSKRKRGVTVALLLALAGGIHLAVAPEHVSEYLPFGLAFYGMAALQLLAALAFAAGRTPVAVRRATVALSLAIAALWATSRLVGLPIGPEPWLAESVGFEDALCTVLEVAAAAVILATNASDPVSHGVAEVATLAPPAMWRPVDGKEPA